MGTSERRRVPRFPARMAAVALTGLVVTLVVYDGMRGKSRRALAPAASSLETLPERENFPAPPPPGTRISLADRPIDSGKRDVTNESLQGFLKEEEKRMGVRKIVPSAARGSERVPYEAPGYRPPPPERLSIDEARGFMRQMTEDIERAVLARRPPTVALQERTRPRLLAQSKNAAMAPGGPFENDKAIRRAAGTVVKDARARAELRDRLQAPLPDVDFDKQMLLVLHRAGDRVVSVAPDAGRLVVRYRKTLPAADKDAPPFDIRVVDRSDLPVIFQELPR